MTRYRIIFCGIHGDESAFELRLIRMGVSMEALQPMIEKAPLVVKRGLTRPEANRYARKLQEAGGLVSIEEYKDHEQRDRDRKTMAVASFDRFTLCPECGLKQTKGHFCVRCGFRLKGKAEGSNSERVKDC
ncbi:MAG: hypothetical protein WAL98_00080 [Desulfatiglandaceae bacterium]